MTREVVCVPNPHGTTKDGAMARIEDPLTRRFVREATLGLSVVVGLLVIIIFSLAHRYGAWRKTPDADDIQLAQVYRRASIEDWNGANERMASAGSESVPTDNAVFNLEARIPRQEIRPATVATPAGSKPGAGRATSTTESSPAKIPVTSPGSFAQTNPRPASLLNPVVPVTQQSQTLEPSRGSQGPAFPETEETVPSPFRPLPANVASASRAFPPKQAQRSERDDVSSPDPSWTLRIDDTLFTYCERNYGDPQWFRALHASLADQGLVFEKLGVGRVLRPPSQVELRQKYPHLVPKDSSSMLGGARDQRSPLVEQGVYVTTGTESLFDLAARLLGQASRYVELAELNEDRLPNGVDYLSPLPKGLQLRLPPR